MGEFEADAEPLLNVLDRLRRAGNSLFVVEHDMAFVREIADVVTVMHMGSLLAQGTISEIEADARVREVYLGEAEV